MLEHSGDNGSICEKSDNETEFPTKTNKSSMCDVAKDGGTVNDAVDSAPPTVTV